MSAIGVKEATTSEELEKIIALRYRILRAPWGQSYKSARDGDEARAVNAYIAGENGTVLACGRMHSLGDGVCQFRYMAVDENFRGKGLGKRILEHLERRAAETGHVAIVLQARENAVGFYERNGYRVREKTFLLWGKIQHYLMGKEISPAAK